MKFMLEKLVHMVSCVDSIKKQLIYGYPYIIMQILYTWMSAYIVVVHARCNIVENTSIAN